MSSSSPDGNNGMQKRKKRRKLAVKQRNTADQGGATQKTGLCTGDTGQSKDYTQTADTATTNITTQVSEEYVSAVMNPNTSLEGTFFNFIDNNPFTPMTAPRATPIPDLTVPPPWALKLMEDIKDIKLTLTKMDSIEQTVNKISNKMYEMEGKVNGLESKVKDCESSCQFISEQCESQSDELKYTKNEVKKLKQTCDQMKENIKQQQRQREAMNEKLVDLESRSMRENLIFYGIKEQEHENCEQQVKSIIQTQLKLETGNMTLDRTYRLGSASARKARPIVAKFHRYEDREAVRVQASKAEYRTQLKDAGYGVGIQWPQQLREARRAFYPIVKDEERSGNRARISGNKLYVNGVLKKKFVDGRVCGVEPDNS